ncbi:ribose-phosphate diphosphokinase [Candidatus Marinamargulisbacteria bacterium SCGC AG-414-C22]|nr:ribose-phosphate diphosphokinase [Candidatus Marinamargulisbacteria bacterium SCGC AG-414-C22]
MTTDQFSEMRLFSGRANPQLGADIAAQLDVDLSTVSLSKFSCGESYARVEQSIRGIEAYIVQSIGLNPNDDYMELFLMMDALKRASTKRTHVIIPHFGYARQDKKSAPREPISSRLIADLLSSVGFDRLITVDLHSDQIQGFFNQPVDHITAMPLFIDYFLKKKLSNLAVVAPDTGRAKVAKKLGDRLGADLVLLHKTRPKHNVAEITNVVGDVTGKNLLIVDDMIDTAGSITSSVSTLRKLGCKDIYVAATHAVFSGPAIERLSTAGFKEVVVTDTIHLPKDKQFEGLKILSMAGMLAEAIKRNYLHESISSLFD